jgi:hypothetical protein
MSRNFFKTVAAFILAAAGLLMLAPVSPSAGQPRADAVTPRSDVPNITAIAVDSPQANPGFRNLFQTMGADWEEIRPFSVIISNQTNRNIATLTLAWTITDAAGRSRTVFTNWESYILSSMGQAGGGAAGPRGGRGAGAGPGGRGVAGGAAQQGNPDFATSNVLPALSQMLAIPMECPPINLCLGTGSVSSDRIPAGRGAGASPALKLPERAYVRELKTAQKITVSIDVVIFQDGRFAGPDEARTLKILEVRHAMVRELVERGRQATKDGVGIADLFEKLGASKVKPEENLEAFFLAHHARNLAATPSPAQSLQSVSTLRPLPEFVRDRN